MAVALHCGNGHAMHYVVEPAMHYQCNMCDGHIAAQTLHMNCNASGCMHRTCVDCVANENVKHAAKKRTLESGGAAVSNSPPQQNASRANAEHEPTEQMMERLLGKASERWSAEVEKNIEKHMQVAVDKFEKIMDRKIEAALAPITKRLEDLEKKVA
eukprot:9979119-Karenia_brevis.AAC.1